MGNNNAFEALSLPQETYTRAENIADHAVALLEQEGDYAGLVVVLSALAPTSPLAIRNSTPTGFATPDSLIRLDKYYSASLREVDYAVTSGRLVPDQLDVNTKKHRGAGAYIETYEELAPNWALDFNHGLIVVTNSPTLTSEQEVNLSDSAIEMAQNKIEPAPIHQPAHTLVRMILDNLNAKLDPQETKVTVAMTGVPFQKGTERVTLITTSQSRGKGRATDFGVVKRKLQTVTATNRRSSLELVDFPKPISTIEGAIPIQLLGSETFQAVVGAGGLHPEEDLKALIVAIADFNDLKGAVNINFLQELASLPVY